MQPSPYQADILKAVQKQVNALEKKGVIVEALAGSGKSTMVWLICQQLQAQGFSPHEVAACVFGKKNREDLQKKVQQKVGSDWGVVVRTIHSLCYGIYRDALNVSHSRVNNESTKYAKIATEFGFFPLKDERRGIDTPGTLLDGAIFSEKDFTDLIDRLRLYCLDATHENVKYLVELYQLGIKDVELVAAAAEYCLSEGLKVATNRRYLIDMTDMVWVPWVMRDDSRFNAAIAGKREQLKFILLDEAQDTDLLQIEMLSLLIHPQQSFLTAVGDRHQAVYFFRGALNDGMDRIQKRFNGENLPLPLCYRCGTKHLDLVREVFPNIPIQPRTDAPAGSIRVVLSRDFPKIFDDEHLSYMGVCRKNAPLVKAAIQLLAAGKPAKIKDKNIGGRLVARVKDICQKQRVKYNTETFIRISVEYEEAQRKRFQDFPNSENQINDLVDMLEAIRALFQAYEPNTFKAWERIVERIFDESGYSPISLYTIHTGKGGEGQVSFILYPEDLPLIHPKQVNEEREQEDHLLYVSLTRTLADGAEGSGILYLVCREAGVLDDDGEAQKHQGKVKWPEWLPKKYCQLWKWDESNQAELDEDGTIEVEAYVLEDQVAEAEIYYAQLEEESTETVKHLQSGAVETSETLQKQWSKAFANQHHSIARTNADKRKQVELLLQDPEWQILSDRLIADHCNVSAPFVGKIRAELAKAGTVNVNSERVDRKGRKLNTAGIGTKSKPKSAPQPAVAAEAMPQGGLPFGLTLSVAVAATKPQPEAGTVGFLEAAFRKDQEQEQARTNRAIQIKAEVAALRDRLVALEAELAAL